MATSFLIGHSGAQGGSLDRLQKDLHPEAGPFTPSALEDKKALSIRSALDLGAHYSGLRIRDRFKGPAATASEVDRGIDNPFYRPGVNDLLEVSITVNGRLQRFLVKQKSPGPNKEPLALIYQLVDSKPLFEGGKTGAKEASPPPAKFPEKTGSGDASKTTTWPLAEEPPPAVALEPGNVTPAPSKPPGADRDQFYKSTGAIFLPVGMLTGKGYPSAVYVNSTKAKKAQLLSDSKCSAVKGTFDGRRGELKWPALKANIEEAIRALPECASKKDCAVHVDLNIADRDWVRPGDSTTARIDYWVNPSNLGSLVPVAWTDTVSWRISSDGWMDFSASIQQPTELVMDRLNEHPPADAKLFNPDLNFAPLLGKERVYQRVNSYAELPQVQELARQIARTFWTASDPEQYNQFYFEAYPPFAEAYLFQKRPNLTNKETNDSIPAARISLSRVSIPAPLRQTHFRFGKNSAPVDRPFRNGDVLRDVIVEGLRSINDKSHGRAVSALRAPRAESSCIYKLLGCDKILVVVVPCSDWGGRMPEGSSRDGKGVVARDSEAPNKPFYLMVTPKTDHLLDEVLVLPEDAIFCYR